MTPLLIAPTTRPPLTKHLPPVGRVVDRISFGSFQDEAQIQSEGVENWINTTLALQWNSPMESVRRPGVTWPISWEQDVYLSEFRWQTLTLLRTVGRRDGIRGMMTWFWLNHLVPGYIDDTSAWFVSMRSLMDFYYRNSTGSFEALMRRHIQSVPLQWFMTNVFNTVNGKNENLGREILELFGLGLAEENEVPRYDPIEDVIALRDILTGHGTKMVEIGEFVDGDQTVDGNGYHRYLRRPLTTISAATHTLVQANQGYVRFTSSSVATVTLPNNLPVGFHILWRQSATAGPTVFQAASGASIIDERRPLARNGLVEVVANADGTSAVYRLRSGASDWRGSSGWLTYHYNPALHDHDAISTFSFFPGVIFSSAVDGQGTAGHGMHPSLDKFIHMLCRHRPHARFLCTKLAIFFLGREPSVLVREAMCDKWLELAGQDNQIAETLKVLFFSSDFCTDYCKHQRVHWPPAFFSKICAFFGDQMGNASSSAITDLPVAGQIQTLYTYVDDLRSEGFEPETFQTPAGMDDLPEQWAQPGAIADRAVTMNTRLAQCINFVNASSSVHFGTNARFLWVTPNDCINAVNQQFLAGEAPEAALNVLRQCFVDRGVVPNLAACATFNINGLTNGWDTNIVDNAVKDVFQTITLLELAHFPR